ncbi:hypothetical protein GZ058_30730, partial [Klebsiella pneumoniae]|nr:hypothetical protein [Klebsiella pneumoniae]
HRIIQWPGRQGKGLMATLSLRSWHNGRKLCGH